MTEVLFILICFYQENKEYKISPCPLFRFKMSKVARALLLQYSRGSKVRWHVKVSLRAIQHISVSHTDTLMEFLLGVLPSTNQSPALLSFHFVSLYYSELKACEQRQDKAVTLVTFSWSLQWITHTVATRPWEWQGEEKKAISGRLDGWLPWVSGSSSSSTGLCCPITPLSLCLPFSLTMYNIKLSSRGQNLIYGHSVV